jgi:hypothetical protein
LHYDLYHPKTHKVTCAYVVGGAVLQTKQKEIFATEDLLWQKQVNK